MSEEVCKYCGLPNNTSLVFHWKMCPLSNPHEWIVDKLMSLQEQINRIEAKLNG